MRNLAIPAKILLFLTLLCSCGVPAQDEPEPFDLPSSAPTPPSPAAPSPGETSPARNAIYLIRDSRLIRVPRITAGPASAMAALLAGPNNSEAATRTRSAIPAGTGTIEVRTEGTVAVLVLPAEFATLQGQEQILAVAQLVFTVTERTGIKRVRLVNGERTLTAPTDSGQLVSRPVGRADYATIAPR